MSDDLPRRARSSGRLRGGKGGAEPRATIAYREHKVVELRKQRYSQREIAEELGISQAAVSKIMRRVSERWAAETKTLLDQHRFETAATLSHLLRASVEQWDRSCQSRVRKRQKKRPDGSTESEVQIDERPGDPRFVTEITRLLDRLNNAQGVPLSTKPPVIGREFSPEFHQQLIATKERLGAKLNAMLQLALDRRDEREREQAAAGSVPAKPTPTPTPDDEY